MNKEEFQTLLKTWRTLDRAAQSQYQSEHNLARLVTQRQWDILFPPRVYDLEPSDASGYSDDVDVVVSA